MNRTLRLTSLAFVFGLAACQGEVGLETADGALHECPSGATFDGQDCVVFVEDFVVECAGDGQICDQAFELPIEVGTKLEVDYLVRSSHCSPVRVDLYVDGELAYASDFLGLGDRPVQTGLVDLGVTTPGTHVLTVRAEGLAEGCNDGALYGWGGQLTARVGALEVPPPPPTQSEFIVECSSESVGQVCDRAFETSFDSAEWVELSYLVASSHCSAVRVRFLVDGELRFESDFLGYGELPAQTDPVRLDVTPGAHTVTVEAEGLEGGCNAGTLSSWGGTLTIQTDR